MSEPGERRRRREMERAREDGAPESSAIPVTDPGVPSRRAMRSQPVPSVGPDGRPGGSAPYQVPGLEPESSQAMRSRRAIRETAPEPGPDTRMHGAPVRPASAWGAAPAGPARAEAPSTYTSRPTVIRPPGATGSVQRPAGTPVAGPPASAPRAPERSVERPVWGASQAGAPSQSPTGTRQPTQRADQPAPGGFQPRSSRDLGPAAAASPTAWGPAAPAPAPSAAGSSWQPNPRPAPVPPSAAQPRPQQPAPQPARQPTLPSAPQPTPQRTGPSWVAAAAADEPVVHPSTTRPAVGSWGQPPVSVVEPTSPERDVPAVPSWGALALGAETSGPSSGLPGVLAVAEDDDDYEDERPSHPYTWLQLIVLALVAFVLGFLIYMLLSNESAPEDPATPASLSGQLAPATPPVA